MTEVNGKFNNGVVQRCNAHASIICKEMHQKFNFNSIQFSLLIYVSQTIYVKYV